MAESIVMPKLAMAMQEGQVVEWLAGEGDWVEKGQIVMTVETEKVAYECEAPASGYLHIVVPPGEVVPVFTQVGLVAASENEMALKPGAGPEASEDAPAARSSAVPSQLVAPAKTGRIVASPIAKKMARQAGLDLRDISGTGPRGRIIKADVEAALGQRAADGEKAGAAVVAPSPPPAAVGGRGVRATIPLVGMRKTIAGHMHQSLAVAAQTSMAGEIDMTEMIRLRETLLRREEEIGLRISFTSLFVWVLARAVDCAPIVNSSLVGEEIRVWENINVGVAVALDRGEFESGLIVPVVKNAGKKSLLEISSEIADLGARAARNELTLDDLSGGTITLSNMGMFSKRWMVSTPIINQPESMIVQPGPIAHRPLVVEGELQVRPVMSLSLTFDHRVVDGVPATHFYNRLAELMENPALLHL